MSSDDDDDKIVQAAVKVLAKKKAKKDAEKSKALIVEEKEMEKKEKENEVSAWDFTSSPLWDFLKGMKMTSTKYRGSSACLKFPGKVYSKGRGGKYTSSDEYCNVVEPKQMGTFIGKVRLLLKEQKVLDRFFILTFKDGRFSSIALSKEIAYSKPSQFEEIYYNEEESKKKVQHVYVGGLKMLDMIYEWASACNRKTWGCPIKPRTMNLDEVKAAEFSVHAKKGIQFLKKSINPKKKYLQHFKKHHSVFYTQPGTGATVLDPEAFYKMLREYGLTSCAELEKAMNDLCPGSKKTYAVSKMMIHHPHSIVPGNESLGNINIEEEGRGDAFEDESHDIEATDLSYGDSKHRAHILVFDVNEKKVIEKGKPEESSASGSEVSEEAAEPVPETPVAQSDLIPYYHYMTFKPTDKIVQYGDKDEKVPLYIFTAKDNCSFYAIRVVDDGGNVSFIPVDD